MQIKLTSRELATILAALRYWQEELSDIGFAPLPGHFSDGITPLSNLDIDELCDHLMLIKCNPHA
jgi:hypothetical protein